MYTFDGEVDVRLVICPDCDGAHESSVGFVLRHDQAWGVYWVSWLPSGNEAVIDLVMGSWEEPDFPDHVTFGCRVRRVATGDGHECVLVAGGESLGDDLVFGRRLSRDEALDHPWLADLWSCVDWMVVHDPILHARIYRAG